ncbi:hypothetical protein ACOSQ4_022392 [Xanthoceras sorbifolium]
MVIFVLTCKMSFLVVSRVHNSIQWSDRIITTIFFRFLTIYGGWWCDDESLLWKAEAFGIWLPRFYKLLLLVLVCDVFHCCLLVTVIGTIYNIIIASIFRLNF